MATKKKMIKKSQPKKKSSMPQTILKPMTETSHKAQVAMSKTMSNVKKGLKNPDVTDTIAKGAVGVAITAGVVAAGAALMNKGTRKMVGKTAKKSFDKLSEYAAILAEESGEQYQTIASSVPSFKKQTTPKRSTKSKRTKK